MRYVVRRRYHQSDGTISEWFYEDQDGALLRDFAPDVVTFHNFDAAWLFVKPLQRRRGIDIRIDQIPEPTENTDEQENPMG